MSRPKKSGGEDCGSWMDTYGDMVTLLLCFFVMLYSMSSLNQQKWEVFVRSIFPSSGDSPQIAVNEEVSDGEYDASGNLKFDEAISDPENPKELYVALMEKLSGSGIDGVSISKGEGYTFLVFDKQTFFEGDRSNLTDEAKTILDALCNVLALYEQSIAQINIMGHTAQANPDRANNPRTDRILSSMRSAEVAAYIQEKNIMDPSKLVGLSYGQYRAVAGNETSEGRAKNRRVEFVIVDANADIKSMNDYYDEFTNSLEEGHVLITGEEGAFGPIGGTSDSTASALPQEEINPPEEVSPPGDAAGAEAQAE